MRMFEKNLHQVDVAASEPDRAFPEQPAVYKSALLLVARVHGGMIITCVLQYGITGGMSASGGGKAAANLRFTDLQISIFCRRDCAVWVDVLEIFRRFVLTDLLIS